MEIVIRDEGYEPARSSAKGRDGIVPSLIVEAKRYPGRWVAYSYTNWNTLRAWAWKVNQGPFREPGLRAVANRQEMTLEVRFGEGEGNASE